MDKNIVVLIVLGVANIPLYLLIGKVFLGGWAGFWDAVKFWLTPDVLSAFNGEYWDDWWAELKLGLFIAACGGCVYGEYVLVQKLFMN